MKAKVYKRKRRRLMIDSEKLVYKTLFKTRSVFLKDIVYVHYQDDADKAKKEYFAFYDRLYQPLLKMNTVVFTNLEQQCEFLNHLYHNNEHIVLDKESTHIFYGNEPHPS